MFTDRSNNAPHPARPTALRFLLWPAVTLTVAVIVVGAAVAASAQSDEESTPAAPVEVSVVAEAEGLVEVEWEVPDEGRPPPTGYRIYYRRIATEPGSQPAAARWWSFWPDTDAGPDERRTRLTGLKNDVWYEVTVVTVHDGGLEWPEVPVLAQPGSHQPTTRPPGRPADVQVAAEGNGSVTLAWEPPADSGGSTVTGYEVWYLPAVDRGNDSSEEAEMIRWVRSGGLLGSDVRRHVVDGLDFDEYILIVAAVNEAGRGLFSRELTGTANGYLDPLSLIADHESARLNTLGTDTWEVWICDVSDGHLRIDLQEVVSLLNEEIPPYFAWLSGRRYRPDFVAGGLVEPDQDEPSEDVADYECAAAVERTTEGGADGALIVLDKIVLTSRGGPGIYDIETVNGASRLVALPFPESSRLVEVSANAVLPVSAYCGNCRYPDHVDLSTVAHEIGHALRWPHSYGGHRPLVHDDRVIREINEYDNPMDMLSGSSPEWHLQMHGLVAGTIAPNRYAAGWIDPEDVAIHEDPYGSYLLAPIGGSGIQMLVLPTGETGHFISLGARAANGYDTGIPAEGVEIYRVDQRASACSGNASPPDPARLTCTGLDRRTRQIPPAPDDDRRTNELTDHVYGPGEGLTVDGFRIEVIRRSSGRYKVWVGNPYRGTFADDEGNLHERNIESLVDRGITQGCDPDLKLYCPDQPLTRAEMARFLVLALDETEAGAAGPSRFSDVAEDAWYQPYVERLADLGITSGFPDGTFRPDSPVTRGQMAVFLTRAFDALPPVTVPAGVFADVAPQASYAAAVEGILAAGITDGCARTPERSYCPEQPVRRDQIATFLARALHI